MKKERCGLKKLHKGFWLCLCAVALVVTCCVVVFHNAQAADANGLAYTLNSDETGFIVSGAGTATSGELTIPDTYNGLPVVEIGREAFLNCTGLTSITIPSSVTRIGWYAFSGCTGLTEITIPDSVTEMDWFAFSNCTRLETVTIGHGVKSVAPGTFTGCTALENVRVGEGVASIGWSAFKDCTNLQTVTIPRRVSQVDRYAFYNCDLLGTVYYTGMVAEWDEITFGTGNDCLKKAERPIATNAEFSEDIANNLRMQDLVKIGYGFKITTNGMTDGVQYGMLAWEDETIENPKVGTENVTDKPLTYSAGYYIGEGEGIYAQRLDRDYYARPYVKIGTEYLYGEVVTYSPLEYAKTILEDESKAAELKTMMVDMLNYGTCAQLYFATQTEDAQQPEKLINADLTDFQKALGSKWNDTLKVFAPELTIQDQELLKGEWAANLNLLEAIQLNIAIKDSSVTKMVYWTGTTIEGVNLDQEMLGEVANFRKDDAWAIGSFPNIVAQNIGDWFCVWACDGANNDVAIRADSVAAYATRLIDSTSNNVNKEARELAKALILYGNSAKAFFDSQNG